MTDHDIDAWLTQSLDDHRLSRGERQALSQMLASSNPPLDRETVDRRAFELARAAIVRPEDQAVLSWLEEVIRTARQPREDASSDLAEAYFSPGDDCPRAIGRMLAGSRRTADICVFTITDDRLADAILEAHRRKVAVRILTDDAKADDLGSDVERFRRADIVVRVDHSPFHMHHKFAILDGQTLLTGSYNWTRGAARDNQENFLVTTDPRFLAPFGQTFERLWASLA